MKILEWLWSFLPDRCEMPNCKRLGIRGNENIIDGVVMCDYCHVERRFVTPTGFLSSVPVPDKPELFNAGRFDGTCPDCGNEEWLEGPSGGMSTNIKCTKCGLWLNHTPVLGLAERIDKK